ncbi:division/cell wall cluster transcriptional repressor MraZ [bacterium]|nr:division/cell wall cluster transcriptional repressor MraZ [bacterium]
MSSLIGQPVYSLDAKFRLNLPAKLRRSFPEGVVPRFIITQGFDACLLLFTSAQWETFEKKIADLSYSNHSYRNIQRVLVGSACETEIDAQGRILIPQNLLSIAKIDKEIQLISLLDKIELWNPAIFKEQMDKVQSDKNFQETIEKLYL